MIWVWRILLTVWLMLVGVAFALLASFWWPMWIIIAVVFLPVVVVSAVVLFSQYFEIRRI
jgi:hypothetical protein